MSQDILHKNLNVIKNRWPQLAEKISHSRDLPNVTLSDNTPEQTLIIDGLHLSSSYDKKAEAKTQAALIPVTARRAWIYGLGAGCLVETLLARTGIRQLTVVLFNCSVAKQILFFFDFSNWLIDPRVKLLLAADEQTVCFPFATTPPCLLLSDEDSARLRDLILLELSTPFIHRKHNEKKEAMRQRIKENLPFVQSDGDVASLFRTFQGKTVIVTGAGPTLSQHYDWLRRQKGHSPIVATDASFLPLLHEGIPADFVVSIDSHDTRIKPFFLSPKLQQCKHVPLIYFPVVHKDVLELWPGPRCTAYSKGELYDEIRTEVPKGTLFSSGSVIHPAIDFAVKSGAEKVILVGADFSFPNQKSHVKGSKARPFNTNTTRHWVTNAFNKKIPTSPSLRGFLRDLESYIVLHPKTIFLNAGNKGALIKGTTHLQGTRL